MTDKISTPINLTTWGGATLAGVGTISATEWLAIGGFILAFVGFVVNWWHKRQMVKIARAELELKKLQVHK